MFPTSPDLAGARVQQRAALTVCVAMFALGQFHRAAGSVFTPIVMDRFTLSASIAAGLVSSMFLATIVTQAPIGVWLDRYGARIVAPICLLVAAGGALLFAVADDYSTLLASRVLIGVGFAAMAAATHLIVARSFEPRNFAYANGLVVSLGGIGGLLGTYPLAVALERLPWTLVFGGVSLATVAIAAGVFAVVPPPTADPASTDSANDRAKSGLRGYVDLVRDPEFRRILTLGAVTYAPITTITGIWGGPYLQDVWAFSPAGAGGALFGFFGATIVGGYLFGLLDQRGVPRRGLILGAVAGSTACLTILALAPIGHAAIATALLAVMIFCQQFYIPLAAHMRRAAPQGALARASTALSLISVAAIPAMQIGMGLILDVAASFGADAADRYRFGFGAMALCLFAAAMVYRGSRQIDDDR